MKITRRPPVLDPTTVAFAEEVPTQWPSVAASPIATATLDVGRRPSPFLDLFSPPPITQDSRRGPLPPELAGARCLLCLGLHPVLLTCFPSVKDFDNPRMMRAALVEFGRVDARSITDLFFPSSEIVLRSVSGTTTPLPILGQCVSVDPGAQTSRGAVSRS